VDASVKAGDKDTAAGALQKAIKTISSAKSKGSSTRTMLPERFPD